jgi:hypothetical protein
MPIQESPLVELEPLTNSHYELDLKVLHDAGSFEARTQNPSTEGVVTAES